MAPALSVRYMVTTLLEVNRIVVRTEVDVLEVAVDFFLRTKSRKQRMRRSNSHPPPTPALAISTTDDDVCLLTPPTHPTAHCRS